MENILMKNPKIMKLGQIPTWRVVGILRIGSTSNIRKSTKWIEWDVKNKVFNVINFIDGSEQILTEKQLMDQGWTNIGHAINSGWLFKED
jgi:hypothetical protein